MRILRDVLYHTHADSGASVVYARGVVLGVVAGLMDERGVSYDAVIVDVAVNLPEGFREEAIPPAFLDSILKIIQGE